MDAFSNQGTGLSGIFSQMGVTESVGSTISPENNDKEEIVKQSGGEDHNDSAMELEWFMKPAQQPKHQGKSS